MATRYLVLGAGKQGLAAGYDFARFGDAETVTIADANPRAAETGAHRLNTLLNTSTVKPENADVTNVNNLRKLMRQSDVCLSAVPYYFNFDLSGLAIESQCHFCDLGGNTDIVWKQHGLNDAAKRAGLTIAPDCGLAPGMANILAAYGIRNINKPQGAYIRVGGLPQNPRPPLGYSLFFNIEGLTNEYFGKAQVLRGGEVTEVDTFTELEEMDFPAPIGRCEAFMTAGGTSTCPWTFAGQLQEYDEKTIRYPGHYEKMKTIHDLGLLDLKPVSIKEQSVVPRDVFHAVVTPLLKSEDPRDVVLLRVIITEEDGKITMDLIDYYDETTGFSAMQRTTGFGAAMVGIMISKGELPTGTVRIEEVVDGKKYLDEMTRRNLTVKISES